MKQYQNIKNSTFNVILPALRSLGVGGIFAFFFLNLIFSQFISPLYFQLINNDKNSTITFIQKIKNLPEYQNILKMNNNIYGSTVKETIFSEENRKKEMINNLEQQLTINPKARDILYSLYQLYLAEGDKNRAMEYLKRAREVDPNHPIGYW